MNYEAKGSWDDDGKLSKIHFAIILILIIQPGYSHSRAKSRHDLTSISHVISQYLHYVPIGPLWNESYPLVHVACICCVWDPTFGRKLHIFVTFRTWYRATLLQYIKLTVGFPIDIRFSGFHLVGLAINIEYGIQMVNHYLCNGHSIDK